MIRWIKRALGLAAPERITAELIERLPPAKLCRRFIDNQLASDTEREAFDALMSAVELHCEVLNGGFNQYYYNTDGERAERARSAFARFGADRTADVARRADACYAACRDRLHAAWKEGTRAGFTLGYKEKIFDAFDREYYALIKNDRQLYELIGAYIKRHPQEFVTDGPEQGRSDET